MEGTVVSLKEVPDETFAGEVLGKGFAVLPEEGKVFSPVNGTISTVMDTKHAIGIVSDEGVELLIHVGINTVELQGEHYKVQVKEGEQVKEGQILLCFEKEEIEKAGYNTVTPVIVTNSDEFNQIKVEKSGKIKLGETVLSIR